MTLLAVRELRVGFPAPGCGERTVVDGVSFELEAGEVLAIVGESGSGKSVSAMSLLGLLGSGARVAGSALLEGQELIGMTPERLRRVRGGRVGMVFQDPLSSLNPLMRAGEQIAEQIRAHERGVSHGEALRRAGELMERMRIPRARERVRAYPHELSGGMRQRVTIAMAISCSPALLLADEPTTALDVTVQAQILQLLGELAEQERMGILLITHDFAVVARIAARVAVMRAGRIVEQGGVERLLRSPQDAYTQTLLAALRPPAVARKPVPEPEPEPEPEPALAELRDVRVRFRGGVQALDGVSLEVRAGETLAIVGESGSGKTTLLRVLARLTRAQGGTLRFEGRDITRAGRRELQPLRRSLGMVFQDPQASLHPRRRVGRTLALALRARGVGRREAPAQAERLLARVGLDAGHAARYPHELSGGERQRVSIARALAGEPRLVLLDEPVSSLDAALRRGAIELLMELQAQLGCGYVLVSHDLSLVGGIAERIAVMRGGRIVELGEAAQVLGDPRHSYTRELLAASPLLGVA